ncbi:hypothetical protein IB236_12895 [Acidovorax sp. ACV02]|uniref:hypothetical protein n=1 Tax=Acidovorax sp. ACV02 TaxID=2769310 RepID=UPI00177C1DAB|nr:hypothetical protein [Acidovorax sp. ACV02]MBD9406238.1 hypothetical protein [Acidovorax sp. ACV02]
MSATSTRPPMSAMLAALLLADIIASIPDTAPGADGLPPGLKELLSAKCDDPTCDACHPTTAGEQKVNATAEAAEETEHRHVNAAVEIPPDVAELVGMAKPGFDPDSLEGHTRLLAAAFIINVRKLGEQPVNTFPKAAATMSGIRYVENTVLAALSTFATLAGK